VDKKDFNQDTTTFVEANSLIRNAKKKWWWNSFIGAEGD
jgi:hypothetical protein